MDPKLEMLSNDVPVLNPRNSCESGFNDVDHMTDNDDENDDQVRGFTFVLSPKNLTHLRISPIAADYRIIYCFA